MEPLSATDEFQRRFFRWALREWEREAAADFPMLRKVQHPSAFRSVEFFESLPRERWLEVSRALTKRFHPRATKLLGQGLTENERGLIERCDLHRRNPSTHEQEISGTSTVTKRQVAAIVKSALSFLGAPERLGGATEWRHRFEHQGWVIHTYLDVGGSFNSASYSHDIAHGDKPPFLRLVSLLSWLGLSGATKWKIVNEADATYAAQTMAELTRHFLSAVPDLTDGISGAP